MKLGEYPLPGLFLVLLNLFSRCLSNRHFCYALSAHMSCSKTVLFPLRLVHHLSLCFLHWLVGTIFFRYFGMSCFVWIAWHCSDIILSLPFDILVGEDISPHVKGSSWVYSLLPKYPHISNISKSEINLSSKSFYLGQHVFGLNYI